MKKIYCNYASCSFNQKLKELYLVKYHKSYVPIGDTGHYAGICSAAFPNFIVLEWENFNFKYKYTICEKKERLVFCCFRNECLFNVEGNCERKEAAFNAKQVKGSFLPYCVTYSDKFISGHTDWMKFVGQEHSHIPDSIREI